jgi:hypothetical protein
MATVTKRPPPAITQLDPGKIDAGLAGWRWGRQGGGLDGPLEFSLRGPDGWATKFYQHDTRAIAEALRRVRSQPKAPAPAPADAGFDRLDAVDQRRDAEALIADLEAVEARVTAAIADATDLTALDQILAGLAALGGYLSADLRAQELRQAILRPAETGLIVVEPAIDGIVVMSRAEAETAEAAIIATADNLRRRIDEFDQRRGWMALGHGSFRAWATAKFPDTSFQYLYRLRDAAQVDRDLGFAIGETPESHARELKRVPPAERPAAMGRADEIAIEAGRSRQARDVAQAAREHAPPPRPAEPSGAEIEASIRACLLRGDARAAAPLLSGLRGDARRLWADDFTRVQAIPQALAQGLEVAARSLASALNDTPLRNAYLAQVAAHPAPAPPPNPAPAAEFAALEAEARAAGLSLAWDGAEGRFAVYEGGKGPDARYSYYPATCWENAAGRVRFLLGQGAAPIRAPAADEPAAEPSLRDGQLIAIALKGWRKEFAPGVVEQLARVAELGGHDAAIYAASAVRRALEEERRRSGAPTERIGAPPATAVAAPALPEPAAPLTPEQIVATIERIELRWLAGDVAGDDEATLHQLVSALEARVAELDDATYEGLIQHLGEMLATFDKEPA